MYQGSNLSRTGQMAVSNDQVSNQLKLLKAKMINRDTWQQGTNQQLDSYPHTQPTKPSQSPLYPKSDYDFYTIKQQQQNQMQSSSQPKITDPRTLNYQQLQQYKQQQVIPPINSNRNDTYLGMNAINRLNYYDQFQKQKEDPYKKNNNLNNYNAPQSYYEQQLNKRQQQQQIQQPSKYYDDLLSKKQQPYGYQQNNNYDFTQQPISLQNKYDFNNYNNNYSNNGIYSNNLQWQNNNQNNLYNNNNNFYYNQQQQSSQSNQYNQYNLYGNQNINTQQQQQQQQQQQSSYNQYNYNQNTQSLSPQKLQQPQPTQQFKYSQHNSQPQFEKRDRGFEKQQDSVNEQYKQSQQISEQYSKPQPRKQIQTQQPSYNNVDNNNNYNNNINNNNKAFNPIDELPAVAKKNQTNSIPPVEDDDDADLQECPEGCGRRFKENVLDKHVKVCKKVFQSKRKEFNSKAHRQAYQEQAKLEKQGQVKDKIIEKKKQISQNGDPKWKKQSEAFRQMISAAKQGGTADIQPQDDLVECPGCGRKFSEQAAERHIPGCKKRNFKR